MLNRRAGSFVTLALRPARSNRETSSCFSNSGSARPDRRLGHVEAVRRLLELPSLAMARQDALLIEGEGQISPWNEPVGLAPAEGRTLRKPCG